MLRLLVRSVLWGTAFGATYELIFDTAHPVRLGVFYGVSMGAYYTYEAFKQRREHLAP